jgi:CheY-like chemotaxis protein
VLLVEDEPSVRRLVRRVLVRQGYQVLDAGCADEALAIAEGQNGVLHLLLTDSLMRGGTGPALAERLGTVRPDTRVLFMSGSTDHAALRRGLLRPGAALLPKPFTAAGLATAVRNVLDRPA